MALDTRALQMALVTHAKKLGPFQDVKAHPPKSAPTTGVTLYLWFGSMRALAFASGLSAGSGLVIFHGRILTNAKQQPFEASDEKVANAVDKYFTELVGNFTLGGLIRNVDVFGESGEALTAQGWWGPIDSAEYRGADLIIPMIINDMWTESA